MGRAPCCDKANVKKGPWSPEEDAKLKSYIEQHGTGGNWIALPQKIGLKRCGKSCRLRWLNYLRPNIRHGGFSEEEDKIICSLYISIGSRWSIIAAQLPGRTDNDIKNYWNTRLKKKLLGKQRKEQQSRRGNSLKQDMRRSGNGNSMVSADNNNQIISPYWPELPVLAAPVPYSSTHQEQRNIDCQASMRRLLIKLGGRFSDDDDDNNNHVINDGSTSTTLHDHHHQQLYEQAVHLPSSSSPVDHAINNNLGTHHFVNSQYTVDGANLNMLQGQSSAFSAELQEMGYSNPPRLDGIEFLYGEDVMVNDRAVNPSETIGAWITTDNTSSQQVVFPSVASEYGGINQQGMLHEYDFTAELRYPGQNSML